VFAALRARLPGREGVLFIRRDNAASLKAHARMGMREVAEFTHGGAVFAESVRLAPSGAAPVAAVTLRPQVPV
jgi:L-amino acid N-acyltransferase YncA